MKWGEAQAGQSTGLRTQSALDFAAKLVGVFKHYSNRCADGVIK